MSPTHALDASQSKPVLRGHGKEGYVPIQLTVPPEIKDALIAVSVRRGTSVMEEARMAIALYLGTNRASESRRGGFDPSVSTTSSDEGEPR